MVIEHRLPNGGMRGHARRVAWRLLVVVVAMIMAVMRVIVVAGAGLALR